MRLRSSFARSGLLATALGLAAATCASAGAAANQPAHPPEATVPFAANGGIENWEADGNKGLWIQVRGRHWYYAKFFAPCPGVQFHEGLGFKFGPSGELDRWSEVFTRDTGRCAFTSLVTSDGPPRKVKGGKPAAITPPNAAPAS
ncbi:MAG: DUF6491 family protein [Steroidobacteraceae bacterium]